MAVLLLSVFAKVIVVAAVVLVVTVVVLFNMVGSSVVRLGFFEALVDDCGPTSKEGQLVSNIQR